MLRQCPAAALFALPIVCLGLRPIIAAEGTLTGKILFEGEPTKELIESGSLASEKRATGIRWVAIEVRSNPPGSRPRERKPEVPIVYADGAFGNFVTMIPDGSECIVENRSVPPLALKVSGYDLLRTDIIHTKEKVRFEILESEEWPIQVLDIVNVRNAWLVPTKARYYAVSDKDGSFKIDGLPAGRHVLRFWHPQIRFQKVLRRSELSCEVFVGKKSEVGPVVVQSKDLVR